MSVDHPTPLLRIELLLMVGAAVAALAVPRLGSAPCVFVLERLRRLAHRRATAVLVIALLTLGLRIALLPLLPIPEPTIHDEFSFLLAADTYSHGRLTNPTHPHWMHFETFHVNHQPSYMSMYPPAQGIVLAIGKAITGHPWFGVWLMTGFACGAMTWALQGWLTPGWAFFGGLLFMARVGLFSYWMNSYYGASVTVAGAALVTGALPRLLARPASGTALCLGAGALVLANSRPYEGALLCATAGVALLVGCWRDRRWGIEFFRHAAVPLALVTGMGALAMGFYNWRVFGGPLTLPYKTNRAMYAPAPVLLWESPGPIPQYRHKVMRDFYVDYELATFRRMAGEHGFGANALMHVLKYWVFFLYPLGTVAFFIGFAWLIRDAEVRLAWIMLLVPALGVAAIAFFMAHYMAPATPAFYVLLIQSMRLAFRKLWPSRGVGIALVRNIALCAMLMAVIAPSGVSPQFKFGANWHFVFPPIPGRKEAIRQLEKEPGKDLVFVRYGSKHDSFQEWVYNAADIDGSDIVWAREMSEAENRELVRYYQGRRRVWLLEPDEKPYRLTELKP